MFVSELSVWISSAHDRYIFSKQLLENSKEDPLTEPYRSKYKAREILNQLISEIERKWITFGNIQVKLLYALFNFDFGLISLETDETTIGCDALNLSWEFLRDIANIPEGCHLAIKILNQLGILWSERGEYQKAIEYLSQAEAIYTNYKENKEICPYDSEDMFMTENVTELDWAKFEKTFTLTLYYMAQVYELADENEKAANYCRETLKRQRKSCDYEVNDWTINCATLSQYYVKKKLLEEARHLLCSALDIANKRENELNGKEVDEETWEEFHKAKALISCCWIKFGIAVLQDSYYSLTDENECKKQLNNSFRVTSDETVIKMEDQIPTYVTTFEEAKRVFLLSANHVAEAKLHYTLNQYANNYVQLIQDHSTLYKCLAFYEPDVSRQCKMLKRRIDMLENVLKKLNPQYYLSVCRQLQFELGEIYFEIMDSKLKIAQTSVKSHNAVKKINSLIHQGLCHFSNFIKSMQRKDGTFPDAFSDDDARPVLIANFYLGRLYAKLIESDTNRRLHNLSKSEECYKFIVNYIEKNPNHLIHVEKEFPIAKEILELMPERISQVMGSTLF